MICWMQKMELHQQQHQHHQQQQQLQKHLHRLQHHHRLRSLTCWVVDQEEVRVQLHPSHNKQQHQQQQQHLKTLSTSLLKRPLRLLRIHKEGPLQTTFFRGGIAPVVVEATAAAAVQTPSQTSWAPLAIAAVHSRAISSCRPLQGPARMGLLLLQEACLLTLG